MKILYYDLETSPILGYAWMNYKTNLLSIEKESGLIGFAYKINDGPVHVLSTRQYTEKQMVKKLWKLFDEADVICAQNGDRFDMRVSNKLFVRHKLKPPSPYKTIDTLKIARKYFRFDSNRLDDLAMFLLGEHKLETNVKLWMDCIKKDEKALKKMEEYCAHDVKLLYEVYQKLKMWHTGHPNFNLYNESTHKCPVCGGNTQKRGFNYTRVGKYQRYQCTKCAAWSQGEKVNEDKVIK
jgi:hypothetical protein